MEKHKRKKYIVASEWTVCGETAVEAESLEEAISIVNDMDSLPSTSEYDEGSFRINRYITDALNRE